MVMTVITAAQARHNWAKFNNPATLTAGERARLKIKADLPLFANIIEPEIWRVANTPNWPGCRSLADVEVMAAANIKRLRRFRDRFPGAENLAERLASCRAGHPCLSGACPICGQTFQRWSVAEITRIVQERRDVNVVKPQRTTIMAISIVPRGAFMPHDLLNRRDLGAIMNSITSKVENTDLVLWGIFGLDISFNDLAAKGYEIGFQAQLYGFVETTNGRKLHRLLSKAFPKSHFVARPIYTKRFDGTAKGASYALKFQFVRRVSYLDQSGRWNTRKVSLKAPEHVKLMLALDRLGLHRRIETIGLHPCQFGNHTGLDWDIE
jgi:hypothetical protein